MNINIVSNNQNFGRAFTTNEKEDYKKLLNDSKIKLGINDTSAIVFDFNVPTEKGYNIGLGTTFSNSMIHFSRFLNDMTGITSLQLGPQGKISRGNTSPYSGTNYSFGTHLIDLKKLTEPYYFELLTDEDIKNAAENLDIDEYNTDYNSLLIHENLLKKAFDNYKLKSDKSDIQEFMQKNKNWLEPELMYSVLTEEYGTNDYNNWSYEDNNLYTSKISKVNRQKRIQELKEKYPDIIEFEAFRQFIAYKQQEESKNEINKQGIKLYGDCLLGFSKSEIWANKDSFYENYNYGCLSPNCNNGMQTWGLKAVDYSKIGDIGDDGDVSNLDIAGKMLYNKFKRFFKIYDGLRIDAAWQFVTPFIYEDKTYNQIQSPYMGEKILNIILAAAKNTLGDNFNIDNIMLELVGMSADKSRDLTKNKYPHLYTTSLAEYNRTPFDFLQNGYNSDKFHIGISNHDNNTLIEISKNDFKRNNHMSTILRNYNSQNLNLGYKNQNYNNQTQNEKDLENFRNAKFAEIFTTSKQFFTLPDMFGMDKRINTPGKVSDDNWSVRIPTDYEKFYYSQLSKGYGLNMPKTLQNAFFMKGIDEPSIIDKLNQAAEILRSGGPLTEHEANEMDKNGLLQNKFEYFA